MVGSLQNELSVFFAAAGMQDKRQRPSSASRRAFAAHGSERHIAGVGAGLGRCRRRFGFGAA
jgi:hypothetical protein